MEKVVNLIEIQPMEICESVCGLWTRRLDMLHGPDFRDHINEAAALINHLGGPLTRVERSNYQ